MRAVYAIIFALALHPALADSTYRWVDKEGHVHYGDAPPNEDAEPLDMKMYGGTAASGVDDTSLPYETRRAKQNFPVTLYVTEGCGSACQQARDFLSKRHIPYAVTTLKTKEDVEAYVKKYGSDSIPSVSVGKTWLKGFQAQQWQDELDAAGYPK